MRVMDAQLSYLLLIALHQLTSSSVYQLLIYLEKDHVQIHSWLVCSILHYNYHYYFREGVDWIIWLALTECTNNFVQVMYTSESILSCVFLDLNDTSDKICCVTHRLCDQDKPGNTQKCSRNFPYNIQLQDLVSNPSSQKYCYTVTASNGTHTVKVNGRLNFVPGIIITIKIS